MRLEEILTNQERQEVDKLKLQMCQAKTGKDIDYFAGEIHQILDIAKQRYRDPEYRRILELQEKAISDERSRLEDAENTGILTGILKVAKSLLNSGMPIHEVAKHTPYTDEELKLLLKKYNV